MALPPWLCCAGVRDEGAEGYGDVNLWLDSCTLTPLRRDLAIFSTFLLSICHPTPAPIGAQKHNPSQTFTA